MTVIRDLENLFKCLSVYSSVDAYNVKLRLELNLEESEELRLEDCSSVVIKRCVRATVESIGQLLIIALT